MIIPTPYKGFGTASVNPEIQALQQMLWIICGYENGRAKPASPDSSSWLWKETPACHLDDSPASSSREGHRQNKPTAHNLFPVFSYFLQLGFIAHWPGCWDRPSDSTISTLLCLGRRLTTTLNNLQYLFEKFWKVFKVEEKKLETSKAQWACYYKDQPPEQA